MVYLLMLSMRRHWLSLWESKRYLRAIKSARAMNMDGNAYDWSTPLWVRRSLRRSAYWALCRVSSESPVWFVLGVACAVPAVLSLATRLALRAANWMGLATGGDV